MAAREQGALRGEGAIDEQAMDRGVPDGRAAPMSGPITIVITANPVAALLSAAGIHAAATVYKSYADAAALQRGHQENRDIAQSLQDAAGQQGNAAMGEESRAAETGFDQLITLAERLGIAEQVRATRPAPPQAGDPEALAAYIRALQTLTADLRAILLTEAARQIEQFAEQPSDLALPDAVPRTLAQRLLARIAPLGPLPENIRGIAQELDDSLPGARAELLASELRARIQAHVEALQARQVQEATATIIEQSLKDLGYQVEAVGSTLFVEGGVVHFRRQGWGDYMVRMRVDAQVGALNFNVIRAVAAGNNERSVLDHIAEDRWCSEFPALLKALEARGIQLKVTRRLAAGELPVQLVDASKLPEFANEDTAAPIAKPLQREMK